MVRDLKVYETQWPPTNLRKFVPTGAKGTRRNYAKTMDDKDGSLYSIKSDTRGSDHWRVRVT